MTNEQVIAILEALRKKLQDMAEYDAKEDNLFVYLTDIHSVIDNGIKILKI